MNAASLRRVFGFPAAAVLAAAMASCSKDPAPAKAPVAGPTKPNLVLITMEATRADHLGCYDNPQARTPSLDALAREGALFSKAIAVAPLTLPSHASIVTALYPPRHGVRDDNGARLQDPETTLAEHLKALGYRTAASIGTHMLAAGSGFGQGFDSYAEPKSSSRNAASVVDDAIAAIDRMKGGPFFVWVQLDDPRAPYAPPQGFRTPFEKRLYDGEIAWMDSQLARLLDHLRAQGLVDSTVVVATADHGESLGEHGEETHGVFLYDSTLNVPLIVRYPPRIPAGTRFSGVVSGVDVAPTALALMGLPPMPMAQGESCAVRLLGGDVPERDVAYAESLFGQRAYGWAPLHALRSSDEKFVDAPEAELYNLKRDPSETINLATNEAKTVSEMWRPSIGEALRVIGGPSPEPAAARPDGAPARDPKALIAASNFYLRARLAVDEGRPSQAVPLLQQALTTDPGNAAAKTLLAALRVDPSGSSGVAANSFASQWSLGNALYERGKLDEAEKAYRAALELDPRNADGWNRLGIVLQKENRRPEARSAYTRALEASPDHADALFNRAKLELLENELPDARRDVDRLLATHKDYAAASFLEAHVCVAEGNTAGAKAALAKFVTLPNADPRMKTVATDMLQKLGWVNAPDPPDTDLRPLGRTGARVLAVSLGGEGILRTTGRSKEAVPVILEALRLGVRYCDTAPAYQQSQDYYGAAFREAGAAARDRVFLASKVHARTRDAALTLLDDSLRRLGTDRLDLWQLHDLRDADDLATIFGRGGAIEAAEQAKAEGRVRFIGLTGHHDPAILLTAMGRYPFDSVLCAVNPADHRRLPFATSVCAEARARGMGVVGMKVLAAGRFLTDRTAQPAELIRYAATLTDTAIVGCSSIDEVRANLAVALGFEPMSAGERTELERRIAPTAARYDYFKAR